MRDSAPRSRRLSRLIALPCAVVVLLLCSPVVVYDLVVYWQARNLIRALKTIEVGKTTGQEAVRIAKRFGGTVTTTTHEEQDPNASWYDAPLSNCVAGDCDLSLYVNPGLPGVKLLRDFLLDHPRSRRRVPMNAMGATLEIKQGLVQDLRVALGSIGEEIQHSASTHISGEYSHATPWNRTPWSIRKVGAHITGGPVAATSEIRVEAWPSAPQDRLLRAFDFDTSCLWLGVHCSRCQILPAACEEYDHGDWYEFIMPEEALDKFRQAVSSLKLGTPENAIHDQLGNDDGLDSGRRLCDLARARRPFDLPAWTILGSESPPRLTYYVKKWRLYPGSPEGPDDRSVTFVLDEDRRLQRIESRVEGIPSRP